MTITKAKTQPPPYPFQTNHLPLKSRGLSTESLWTALRTMASQTAGSQTVGNQMIAVHDIVPTLHGRTDVTNPTPDGIKVDAMLVADGTTRQLNATW